MERVQPDPEIEKNASNVSPEKLASGGKEASFYKPLAENHWFRIAEKLAKESGKVPDPLVIRAETIISVLGLPSGEISALETNERGKRTSPEKDRVIAEYLTNKPGVLVDEKIGVVSSDFRDIYPDGLPQKLQDALNPDTRAIMKIEYEHAQGTRDRFGDTNDVLKADVPVHYFRLPGGIDLFLRGYVHSAIWHSQHADFLQEANKHARVICIEGFSKIPFGESLNLRWSENKGQKEDYDALMHEAVSGGFDGFFAEVDARDSSKVSMDNDFGFVPDLPDSFFRTYFAFLNREHPRLAEKLGSPEGLQGALIKQSNTEMGIGEFGNRMKIIYRLGKSYTEYPYLEQSGRVSLEPTFLELGKHLFSDALAAIKLLLIARLMADRHLPKGPIVDYEGAGHISSKSFFLRYPEYAAEVVLRTINELMAGKVEPKKSWFGDNNNIEGIQKILQKPDWPEILREIVRLPFKKVEDDASKPTAIGPNQRKLLDYPVDFLGIYGIDPEQVMPTDEEMRKIREKIGAARHASA